MSSNVIHLPRGPRVRPSAAPLALFIRVGHNDHRELLDLIAAGERGISGFIVQAQYVRRHQDLIVEARNQGFDLVLDPKTHAMGLPGGHTEKLAALPWGSPRHHILSDFDGPQGRSKAEQIVNMAVTYDFTQLLGPTHVLTGPNDPWLRRDITMMQWTYEEIAASGADIRLIHSLTVPMELLRKPIERQVLIDTISDIPCQAIWLKIENFGDDATGEKTGAYIDACQDFHDRGIPLIGDQVGGLPRLGLLAFGAVGGIAHGVTMEQSFRASAWRRPATPSSGGMTRRVYFPRLDVLLKHRLARILLSASPRLRAQYGCRDTHCCAHGIQDMLSHPARHALYQRAREVEWLTETPQTVRAARYLDERVRPVSDDIAAIVGFPDLDETLRQTFVRKQRKMSRFRSAMAHLSAIGFPRSVAVSPPPCAARSGRSR